MAGKRRTGPAPKGAYAGKSMVLSTRITPETRAALVEAKTKSGRSLSQEIEHRLRRSFDHDERVIEIFGSRQNYAVLRLIAAAMEITNPVRGGSWRDDPFAYEQMIIAVNTVLAALRPPGEPSLEPLPGVDGEGLEDDPIARATGSSFLLRGALRAEDLLQRIKQAAPSLPVPPRPIKGLANLLRNRTDPVPFIRDDLGALVERIPQQGTVAEEAKRRFWTAIFADVAADEAAPAAVRKWAADQPAGPPPEDVRRWLGDLLAETFAAPAVSELRAGKESDDGK